MSKKQGQRPAKDVLKDSFREIYGGKKKECQHSGAVDGKTNYALLCRFLASLGSKVLREVFDRKIPPQDLYIALKRESVYSKLLSLQKQEILSPEQWCKLYPVNPSSVLSTGFDPDLLIVLLRTICNLSPPATGWDIPPNSLDTSCESDIIRLKYLMNAVSTHAEKDSVSDAVFCEYKDEIQKTLVRLGGDEYNDAICEMEKQEMGPLDKEHFKGLLKQWKDGDDRIKDKLNKWECIMKTSRDTGAGAVDGKTNYALLCRFLASLGSKVLREVFDRKIPPQDLCIALKRESVYSNLLSLQKQEILSPEQWCKLYPVNPSSVLSTGFDPDLLIVLLRTICNLSPPATGWDIPPNSLDTSCESDIIRLKYLMNAVSTHAEKDSVSDAVFCEYKDEIQKTLVRLGGDEYNDAICEMEKQEMGPLDKEHFKGLLKQWKDGDDRIKDKLNKWECIMKTSRDTGAGAVDGKANYALLCRFLASLGSKVLREVFDRKIPPQDLYIALKRESVYSKLLSLQKQEILSPEQWCKLYPVNPSSVLSTGFDPDLLIVLLRTICNLSPPATGWDIPPNSLDTSCESDIVRLKYFMNAVSTHAEKDSVSDAVFCEYKDEIQKTLVRLGGDEYKDTICEMEKQEMGPLDKEHFKGLLKQWKDGDDRIKDKLKKWECLMKTSRDAVADTVQPEASCANVVPTAGRSSTHSHQIADCESDIRFFAERHDPDTRNWLFDDFNKWFSDPGESRAYVLLGDAGVGKSVIAGALAQRMRKAGHLGAAYFCHYNDDTRNDPRCLLGTVASQLCKCNNHYNNTVGGIDNVITMLHNDKLGVQELFTKLLEEPLAKCTHSEERKLVIIDALDETEYESRKNFLCLITKRFLRLPQWLMFFITSRPEGKMRRRLEEYKHCVSCVRICAGDRKQNDIYQQHEGDIRRFFENGVDFSLLRFTVEEISKSCNGLFLHAFCLRKKLNDLAKTEKMDYTLSDLLVDDCENFFEENFERVFSRVGKDLYEKLIGCVLAAPSPLPVSFIPFVLQQEASSLDKQEVIDAVMQFALNQTANDTVTFLHKRIPTWLKKNPRKRDYDCSDLLIDKKKAEEYLARIFEEILSGIVTEPSPALSCINENLQDYAFRFAIRFLCKHGNQESVGIVFRCLTNFHFLEKRIESGKIGIYHLLEDLKDASCCSTFKDLGKKNILHEISSNAHVLLECPHLLMFCLPIGSKILQETDVIPNLSGPKLEWSTIDVESTDCLLDFNVFATALDQRTVAVSNGRSIAFVDASRLTIMSGPFEVSQKTIEEIKHLEFSPDGKWVFFGRLDKWFSVERKSVEGFSQFSGNEVIYEWSTHTLDDQYIVVKRIDTFSVSCKCVVELLTLWASLESHLNRGEMTDSLDIVRLSRISPFFERFAVRLLAYRKAQELKQTVELFRERLVPCHHCKPFCEKLEKLLRSIHDLSLTAVRRVIVELYLYIFDFQVWNINSGRPLLYDVFSLSVQLNEFTYFWHVIHRKPGKGLDGIIAKDSSISNIAVAYAFHAFNLSMRFPNDLRLKRILDEQGGIRRKVAWLARMVLAFSRKNFYLFGDKEFGVSFICVSPLKKWLLLSYPNEPNLLCVYSLSKGNKEPHFLDDNFIPRDLGDRFVYFTFTNDDGYFIYSTSSGSLHALCLQTGTILKGISGKTLFSSTDESQFCYLFQSTVGERKEIILTDLLSPLAFLAAKFVLKVHPSEPLSLCSPHYDSLMSMLPFTHETISFLLRCLLDDYRKQMLDNFVLSPDGKLIAIHRGNNIELISFQMVFRKREVFTVYEQQSSFTATLTFSADCKLLLFCVQDGARVSDPHFHEWDVEKGVLVSFKFPVLCPPMVECCCLSSDKARLILCGDNKVEIWKYGNGPCRFLDSARVSSSYSTFNFSQCTLSVENNLLACSIENIVVLFSLRDHAKTFLAKGILRGHLARIVFCKFLKVNRYLITYDINGLVFLWDLTRTKAVAFAKITQDQESIVSLLVSPKEDKAVCLLSSSRICVIELCTLEEEPLSKPMEDTVSLSEISGQTVRELISKSEISPETSRDEDLSLSQWEEDMYYVYDDDDDDDDDNDDDDGDDDDDDKVDKYD